MTTQNGRAFNEWLRAQLKIKKMSQRQLAQQSGVDHSTISRLIRGDRMPSLGTATKLARGLRELRDDADTPQYLRLVSAGAVSDFVERHPSVKILALSFLLLIGVMLVAEGMGTHMAKGYVYFAMAFSLFVEMLNMRYRRRRATRRHAPA